MLKFLTDENFNGDIVRGLFLRCPDLDLVRVQDVGLQEGDDPTILEWAAINQRIVLTHAGANLKKAKISGANLQGTNLAGADLSGANLSGSQLKEANLAGTDLTNAKLDGADLAYANFGSANLTNASLLGVGMWYTNLGGANMRGARLKAQYCTGSISPDGTPFKC